MGVGQTREHVRLARSLGVSHVIVAVSKMDACGYSEERFEFIKKTLELFLAKSGFGPGHVSWVPVSGFEGVNLVPGECAIPVPNALSEWWNGGEFIWFSNCLPILTLCFVCRDADGVYRRRANCGPRRTPPVPHANRRRCPERHQQNPRPGRDRR